MKAITLTQPWATLVAIGAKKVETRGWSTSYRGPLAIHAAKGGFNPKRSSFDRAILMGEHFDAALKDELARGPLPLGCVLAIVELIDCRRTEELETYLSLGEIAFGDYSPGRFGFKLQYAQRLINPVPARGMLGLWEWEQDFQGILGNKNA